MNERTERETGIRIRIRKNRERNWDKDREGSFQIIPLYIHSVGQHRIYLSFLFVPVKTDLI